MTENAEYYLSYGLWGSTVICRSLNGEEECYFPSPEELAYITGLEEKHKENAIRVILEAALKEKRRVEDD